MNVRTVSGAKKSIKVDLVANFTGKFEEGEGMTGYWGRKIQGDWSDEERVLIINIG